MDMNCLYSKNRSEVADVAAQSGDLECRRTVSLPLRGL